MSYKEFVSPKVTEEKIKGTNYIVISPEYSSKGKDIMKKGNKFYAVFDPRTGLWSKDREVMEDIIDYKLYQKRNEIGKKNQNGIYQTENGMPIYVSDIEHSSSKKMGELNKWLSDLGDNRNLRSFDEDLTFKSDVVALEDYRSKRLKYDPTPGETPGYNKLMSVLYLPEELQKIEWAIGSILAGEGKHIDKMLILYGSPKTGKSTVLSIIRQIFAGYCASFTAEQLADRQYQFATAAFKDNPLVAIQDDGSLSKINDPRINILISHETFPINEKGIPQYEIIPNAMLFMATNERIDIRNTGLGITRRFIDVYPTGNIVKYEEFCALKSQIKKEIPQIAYHCLEVFNKLGVNAYINYSPVQMIHMSSPLINFLVENYNDISSREYCTLNNLYMEYKKYFEDCGYEHPPKKIDFKEEISQYFSEFFETYHLDNGKHYTNVYKGFKKEKLGYSPDEERTVSVNPYWIEFKEQQSYFDEVHKNSPAQYAVKTKEGNWKPKGLWKDNTKVLSDLDTSRMHYVKALPNEIVIDFDIQRENGEKLLEENLKAANLWKPTYAELSKSGAGIHLHYIYDGDDIDELENLYEGNKFIEIKRFKGGAAIRRLLTKCNDIPIMHIDGSVLPKKERKPAMINKETVRNEKILRSFIFDCLDKKHHGATKPEVDFIKAKLDEYYNSGVSYDVRDLRTRILAFAMSSSHQADKAVKVVNQMQFCSEEFKMSNDDGKDKPIIFYDIEVFPNLFLVNWKYEGEDKPVMRMINPSPSEIEDLVNNFRLIGFNNRRYDNHIMYARMMGYTLEELYSQSQAIINGDGRKGFFGEAYNLSYTDVYDFSNTKQSLKKWEIELGLHHQELGLPWDQPVPEELWAKVAEYCDNDVIATEAVFHHLSADWTARQILADISGLTVNDTTNNHTCAIIFGSVKHPQTEFVYTDLSEMFPGYKFENGKSTYRGEEVGEGGYVYAEPGIYENVALLDIASMHPTSLEQLNLFGPYTENFSAIKQARIYIKHEDYESAGKLFDGKLKPYLNDKGMATDLAFALKIAINSVYGLTSAKFENRCRDPRNVDNIVAKRGALFMINLKHEVQKCGFTVAHIKTDSIKIPNATPEIINFVMEYGKSYGYTFEHEATYDRMCLVNDAVYIAKYKGGKHDGEWTATGAEFQHPFIFKSLFSHEPIEFRDLCETKTVQTALYLDMNENLGEGEHNYIFVGKAGSFCPIKPGCGGGELVRLQGDKYYSATKAKGWRWLEAEDVQGNHEEDIDMEYFDKLCKDAIKHINEFGNFEEFAWGVNIEPREDFMNKPE